MTLMGHHTAYVTVHVESGRAINHCMKLYPDFRNLKGRISTVIFLQRRTTLLQYLRAKGSSVPPRSCLMPLPFNTFRSENKTGLVTWTSHSTCASPPNPVQQLSTFAATTPLFTLATSIY